MTRLFRRSNIDRLGGDGTVRMTEFVVPRGFFPGLPAADRRTATTFCNEDLKGRWDPDNREDACPGWTRSGEFELPGAHAWQKALIGGRNWRSRFQDANLSAIVETENCRHLGMSG